jgi:predicted RNA-binding Zn ribbon-like protein
MSRLTYTADMAIEDRTDTHPGRIDEHYCEHPGCNLWGGFGLASGQRQRWWCWEHYPYKEPGSTRTAGTLPA